MEREEEHRSLEVHQHGYEGLLTTAVMVTV
jgi:hypothetical protein